jgi:hypothetical protein
MYGTVTGVGAFFSESTQNLNPPSGGKDCLPFPEMIKSYAVIKLIKALPISKRITSPLHVGRSVDAAEMLEVEEGGSRSREVLCDDCLPAS